MVIFKPRGLERINKIGKISTKSEKRAEREGNIILFA
jgi:hypothetical protein